MGEERQIEQQLASCEQQIQALERQIYDFQRAWTSTPEGQAEQQKVELSLQKMYHERGELQWSKKQHEYHLRGGPEPPMNLGRLHVRVYRLDYLEPDSGGFFQQVPSCDPYIKLRFCGVEYRTTTAFNKKNPEWDEEATFTFRGTEVGQDLEVVVMNASGNTSFGHISINPRWLKNKEPKKFEEYLKRDDASTSRSRPGLITLDVTFEMTSRYVDMCKLTEMRTHLDQASAEYTVQMQQMHHGTLDRPTLGQLQVRILRATNLQPLRQGAGAYFNQDMPSPFVSVCIGREAHRTRSWHNDLNPRWDDEVLSFRVVDDGANWIELTVMDDQERDERVFGRARLDLRALKNRNWEKFDLPLQGSNGAVISFDCCFCMSNLWVETCKHRDTHTELEKAQVQRERATQEVKQLEQMVEMAEESSRWLRKFGDKDSVEYLAEAEERIVISPTFLAAKRGGRERQPTNNAQKLQVALFPDVKIEKDT